MVVTMSTPNWYTARLVMKNGAIAVGYGIDVSSAILNCIGDAQLIRKLNN